MKNLSLYCLSLEPDHLEKIKKLDLIPVGLGKNLFNDQWLSDKIGLNISSKNKFYGEYTFHYMMWKNYLDKLDDNWIGFCQYRKFWCKDINSKISDLKDLKKNILTEVPKELDKYESIIGDPYYINQFRFSKFIKRNLKKMIKSPSLLFNKNKRNIRFHFDMWHGEGNLDKAIDLLDINEKKDFKKFVETNVAFNPHNMFICKSKETLKSYYKSIFPWLERCEAEFGFENLKGYGQIRIYGFLAERYMSYWFQKYTSFKTYPILFKDISNLD